MMMPRVLIIAGSDPSGGAGIQADIKTIHAFGGYAMAAITALTAQNTTGVYGVHPVPPAFVAQQVSLCLNDIGADAIKTGMLFSEDIVEAVHDTITKRQSGCASALTLPLSQWEREAVASRQRSAAGEGNIPLILDPVMVAKGGSPLLKPDAIDAVRALLIPRAALITPNIPEAELLTGIAIETASDMQRAGEALLNLGAQAALIKGGHLAGDTLMDVLVSHEGAVQWQSLRIKSEHTHGTGCTLASAIATCLAHGIPVADSVARARDYVLRAIGAAPRFGSGHGPLNHQVRA